MVSHVSNLSTQEIKARKLIPVQDLLGLHSGFLLAWATRQGSIFKKKQKERDRGRERKRKFYNMGSSCFK